MTHTTDNPSCNYVTLGILAVTYMVQWLKLHAEKVGKRGIEPCSGIQVSKKQNVSSPLTHKDAILWGAYVTER